MLTPSGSITVFLSTSALKAEGSEAGGSEGKELTTKAFSTFFRVSHFRCVALVIWRHGTPRW